MLFDTHVNLHAEQFADDLQDVLARARAAGVTRFVAICDRLDRFPAVKAIAHANDDIACTVGVHPHYAKDFWSLEAETLVGEARDLKVVGIGETGLDQHYGYSDIVAAGAQLRRAHPRGARDPAAAGRPHARGRRSHRRHPRARVCSAAPFRS